MCTLRPCCRPQVQRLTTLTNIVRAATSTAKRPYRPESHSRGKRRAQSQPAPYQWAPLSDDVRENEALERKDFGKFVQFFRQASPYIEGHRGRTFVVVIPGEVRAIACIAMILALSLPCLLWTLAACTTVTQPHATAAGDPSPAFATCNT